MNAMLDAAVAMLLLAGGLIALISALGLVRLKRFYERLHAPSIATTLAIACVLAAVILGFFASGENSIRLLLLAVALFVTAPLSAQLLVQAALRQLPDEEAEAPPPAKVSDQTEG
jgi:multicomponent K+:H+ antiporter subunit G